MLKRKLEDTGDDGGGPGNASTSNGQSESDDSNCSAGSTDALAPEVASGPPPPKRMKKKVNFKGVTVYYFPRRQGFTCVPSEGGSTLGMSERHSFTRDFSLSDYTKEQKRIHRAILAEQRRQGKMFPSPLLATSLPNQDHDDDISSGSESDSEYDDYYFLQPLPIRQRRVLLRTAGVKKIDNEEKDDCRDIRVSRNVCGCDCKVFCDPATCSCSLAGIQCQVDRLSFPCGCTKDGCSNPAGRIEFNPIRVRTHFIHTLMRLELERKDSECPEGNSSAATTSMNSSFSTSGEIDVVGANGEEEDDVMSAETTDNVSDDSCSGASTDASTSGVKVLKSKLKTKKVEAIDLNMFNSNERGSCRDCQNTDMCNVMMHDVKFSMVTQQQRQQQQHQQRVIATALGPQPGYPGSPGPQLQQHHHLSLSPGISLLHPPPPPQQQQSPQHMLLFNDGEEEVYQAENTTSMYFDNDDASYSEMSDTSAEALEPRPFASLSQANFSGKFHVSPSQMFATSISSVNNSSNGPVHSQTPSMSTQTSLLNPSCIRSLQVNNVCGGNSSSTSCSSIGMEQQQQQSCGLLTHPHPQQSSTAAVSGQSLLRPQFLPGAPPLPSGHCGGPSTVMTSNTGLLSINGPVSRTQMDSGLELDVPENSMMLQGGGPNFQNKFSGNSVLEPPGHQTPASFKLESSVLTSQTYGSSRSSVTTTDYIGPSNHISNFSSQTATGFGNATTTAASNGNSSCYETVQTPHLSSCWSTSLTSPTLRECFGLGTAPSNSTDQSTPSAEISCNASSYPQESGSCAITAGPASPSSSTTTYATMTTTTRDRLAAHCPGISSHMDGKPESTTSTLKDQAPSFSSYHLTNESSETSSLVGNSQSLLYNLPYPDTSTAEPSDDLSVTSATCDINKKSSDSEEDSAVVESSSTSIPSPPFSSSVPSSAPSSSVSSELSETSPLFSTEISSTCLPLSSSVSLHPSSTSVADMSTSASNRVMGANNRSLKQLSSATRVTGSCLQSPLSSSHENDAGISQVDSLSTSSPVSYEEGAEEKTSEISVSQNSESAVESGSVDSDGADLWESKDGMWESGKDISSWSEGDKMKGLCKKRSTIDGFENERNCEACVTDSEMVSSAPSSVVQSTASSSTSSSTSSSSSSPTLEEERDQSVGQNFGEIIKESIVEMVLV